MSRGRRLKSRADYDRAVRNGFGVGSGLHFKSWLTGRDAGKRGRRSRVRGITQGRDYVLLSDGETGFFELLDKAPNVVDIREQFPLLPMDVVCGIAKRYGILYPIYPDTREPAVLSTDFLATITDGASDSYAAFAVKDDPDLRSSRVLRNLEIERLFWTALGVPWHLILKSSINLTIVANITWVAKLLRASPQTKCKVPLDSLLDTIFTPRAHQVDEICGELSEAYSIDSDSAKRLMCRLIWSDVVQIDLRYGIEDSGLIEVIGIDRDHHLHIDGDTNAAIAQFGYRCSDV